MNANLRVKLVEAFIRKTGATMEQAVAELIAEEWDLDNALLNWTNK